MLNSPFKNVVPAEDNKIELADDASLPFDDGHSASDSLSESSAFAPEPGDYDLPAADFVYDADEVEDAEIVEDAVKKRG